MVLKVIFASSVLFFVSLLNVGDVSGIGQSKIESGKQHNPKLPETDRIRLAEAFRIGESLGNRIWSGWDKAPFAVLLVTPDNEFLIRHPRPSTDFTLLGYDPLLKSAVYFRKRTQPINFLATFPLVGGISTIVIGQAENTSVKTSTPWVVTVLHEHFHQLQDSQPDFYRSVQALDLSGGDQTGMWMLNYPFPYSAPEVKREFDALSNLLAETIQAENQDEFSSKSAIYLTEREKFNRMLSPADYKYLSFQLWKEGVSRYTELRIAELAARSHQPGKEFLALKDYSSFKVAAEKIRGNILRQLATLQLDQSQREAFYPFGAGEALLLDKLDPKWQKLYFTNKFDIYRCFKKEPNAPRLMVKNVKLSSGVILQYAEQGDASGTPVILLHGYTDSWRSFELVLPHLPSSIHAFAVTQRGHGDSGHPKSGYLPRDFAQDLAAFMDALKLKKAIIVGHSMGSQVALRFVLDHPERVQGLVLAGAFTTVKGHEGVKQLWDSTIAKMTDPVDANFVREFQQSTLHKPVPPAFLETVVRESGKVPANVWRGAMAGLMETDFSAEIGKINLPTLIVWGDQDLFFPRSEQDKLTNAINGSRLLVYNGIGHAPHWEEPSRFAVDLTDFVGKIVH